MKHNEIIYQVGTKVRKISNMPFKSTFRINTIKEIIEHPITKREAYTFIEDDSYVETRKCITIEGK